MNTRALRRSAWLLAAATILLPALTPGEAAPARPGGSRVAPWSFFVRLGDPDYASRAHREQADPLPRRRVRSLLHPTTGAPALAWSGGTLELIVAEAITLPARGVTVTLETQVGGERLLYPLRLLGVTPEHGGRHSRITFIVPARVPRESFDLELRLPSGRTERHVRAVRVLHLRTGPLSLALMADHQLWDPSSRLFRGARRPGLHPPRGGDSAAQDIALQGLAEMDLLDPDLVLHLGDLIFGLDPEKERSEALRLLSTAGPAAFLVPGNHDGYARYGIDLKASLPRLAVGMVECRRHLKDMDGFSWRALWAFLSCVYGDLRPVLFQRLLSDGLVAWRRTLGPTHYAFDLGPFRLLGLNTYDGTPERRHAYSIHAEIRGLRLGAPLVDNYGGTLSEGQLRWVDAEARGAGALGLHLLVFGHHDPRGNPEGPPYHANQPFPTDPVGPNHFEAWNYDGPWDSDPSDGRAVESPTNHSGHGLLRILARQGGTYLSGHVHRDRWASYAPGEALRDGILAERPLAFGQVTTASAAPGEGGYWGYRLLTLTQDGRVESRPFAEELGLLSLPSGLLWSGPGQGGEEVASLHTGLPRPVRVRVRAILPFRAEGYRFTATPATAQVALVDVVPVSGGRALYHLSAHLPAAGATLAKAADDVRRFGISAEPLSGNRPPRARLTVNGQPRAPGARILVLAGAQVTLTAEGSEDPEGHALLPPLVEAENGRGGREKSVALTAPERGDLEVRLVLWDAHGAEASTRVLLTTRALPSAPRPTGERSGESGSWAGRVVLWTALAVILLGIALILFGRRRG